MTVTTSRQGLGNLVRTIRYGRGQSVDVAASTVGLSPVTWRRIERGQGIYEPTIRKLGVYLRVPIEDIESALAGEDAMVALVARTQKAIWDAKQNVLWRLIEASAAAGRMRALTACSKGAS